MTRKLFYIGLTIFTLTIGSIITHSCRDVLTVEAKICSVTFTGINPSNDNSPDKFLNDIGFLVMGHRVGATCYFPTDFNFISTCYATSPKCVKWQNDFMTSSFQILLDRQVIIAGETVKPNADLFQKSMFRDKTTIKKVEDCQFVVMTIMLTPDLVSQMTFEQGVYNVTFNCNTTDNKTFINQRQVIFKP